MAQEIKDIQQLINERADSRLEKLLKDIHQSIFNGAAYHLCKNIMVNAGTAEKPKMISLSSVFGRDGFLDRIIADNKERFREDEAKTFLEKVESLRSDVDNLLNNVQDDY